MKTVLVTDAGSAPAVAVIRSLGSAGYRVVAAGHSRLDPGLWSRHTAARHVVTPAEVSADRAATDLLGIVEVERVDVVVPVSDQSTMALVARRPQVERRAVLTVPPDHVLLGATDKRRTLSAADRTGVTYPRTIVAAGEEAVAAAAAQIGYPVVLKPPRSHVPAPDGGILTCSVTRVASPEELARAIGGTCGPLLVQECVPGVGVGIEVLAEDGRAIAAFQHRRIHEVPLDGGMSSLRVSERPSAELLAAALRLVAELRWTGVAMVEFRVGAGGHHLMEVNGRVWGSMALPVRAGMDFPRRLVELFLGGSPPPGPLDTRYRQGVELRNLELELRWAVAVLRRSVRSPGAAPGAAAALGAVGALARPGARFDVQTARDAVPGLLDVATLPGRVAAGARWRSKGRPLSGGAVRPPGG